MACLVIDYGVSIEEAWGCTMCDLQMLSGLHDRRNNQGRFDRKRHDGLIEHLRKMGHDV